MTLFTSKNYMLNMNYYKSMHALKINILRICVYLFAVYFHSRDPLSTLYTAVTLISVMVAYLVLSVDKVKTLAVKDTKAYINNRKVSMHEGRYFRFKGDNYDLSKFDFILVTKKVKGKKVVIRNREWAFIVLVLLCIPAILFISNQLILTIILVVLLFPLEFYRRDICNPTKIVFKKGSNQLTVNGLNLVTHGVVVNNNSFVYFTGEETTSLKAPLTSKESRTIVNNLS